MCAVVISMYSMRSQHCGCFAMGSFSDAYHSRKIYASNISYEVHASTFLTGCIVYCSSGLACLRFDIYIYILYPYAIHIQIYRDRMLCSFSLFHSISLRLFLFHAFSSSSPSSSSPLCSLFMRARAAE